MIDAYFGCMCALGLFIMQLVGLNHEINQADDETCIYSIIRLYFLFEEELQENK